MSFEEMDTQDSASSLGEVSSLDDDLDAIYLELRTKLLTS